MLHLDLPALVAGVVVIVGTAVVTGWSWWVSREKGNPDATEPWHPEGDQGSEE